MKAVRIHGFGKPPQLDEVPEPQPGEGERLASVRYVALNPIDIWMTKGTVAGGQQTLPMIIGTECLAEVDGQLRLIWGGGLGTVRDGVAAERAVVPAGAGIPLPEGVDEKQAAALGIAGVTAWRLVHEVAAVRPDDVALVLGATGGVGTLLVQLLPRAGAQVVAQTSSAAKVEGLRSLGVDSVIVDEAADVPDLQPSPTVVFDPLGGAATARGVALLRPHGRLVLFGTSMAPTAELDLRGLYRKGSSVLGYSGTIEPEERLRPAAQRVIEELAAGDLRVPIDSVLPLSEAAAGFRRILERKVAGKILLKISD